MAFDMPYQRQSRALACTRQGRTLADDSTFQGALAAILMIAAVARFVGLGTQSLWLDEGFTVSFISHDWTTLWFTAFDNTPALYYSILKLIASPTSPEWLLRLPSAFAGLLWVAVIMVIAREVGTRETVVLAGAFAALSSLMIDYSQEARAYSLQALFTSLTILATIRLLKQEERFPPAILWLYGLSLVLGLYTHMVAVFAWLISAPAVALWFALEPSLRRRAFIAFFIVNVLVLLAWSPWIYLQAFTERAVAFDWLEQQSPLNALGIWLSLHSDVPSLPTGIELALMFVALAAVGLGVLAALKRGQLVHFYLLALYIGGPVLIYLIGFIQPVLLDRTLLWTCTASSVLFGLAVSWRLTRPAAISLAAASLLLSLVTLIAGGGSYREKEDWRGAYAFLAAHAAEGDDVLVPFRADFSVLRYYDRLAAPSLFQRVQFATIDEGYTVGSMSRVDQFDPETVHRNLLSYEWVLSSNRVGGSRTGRQLREQLLGSSLPALKLSDDLVIQDLTGQRTKS